VVGMRVPRKIGSKGQIVIPKIIRDYLGVKPGDTVILEVREGEIVIIPGTDPREFVEGFCSVIKEKLTERIDLERLIESEVEERLALH